MNRWMKCLVLALALLLALTLGGCGDKNAVPASQNEEKQAQQTEAAPAVKEEAASEPTAVPVPVFEPLDWSGVADSAADCFTYEIVQDSDPVTDEIVDCVKLLSYTGSDMIIKIPDQIDGMYVRQCAKELFKGNTSITYVHLPKYMRTGTRGAEANNMFNGCTALLQVHMPVDAALIPIGMFQGCTALREVTFPVTEEGEAAVPYGSIGNSAFRECAMLTEMTLPTAISSIGNNAFKDCVNLEAVTAPSAGSLGDEAFAGCAKLQKLIVRGQDAIISGSALNGCVSLTDITFTERVDYHTHYNVVLENGVLYQVYTEEDGGTNATLLRMLESNPAETVQIREDTDEIGLYAFANCGIRYLTLPARVDEIESGAFNNCPQLEWVETAPGSELISVRASAFRDCPELTMLNFSTAHEELNITDDMYNCPKLEKVVMPGEDPHATPTPEPVQLSPEEAESALLSAIENAFAPYKDQMDAAGFTYKITTENGVLRQAMIYTGKTELTQEDSALLHDICVALTQVPETGFDDDMRNQVNNTSFEFWTTLYTNSGKMEMAQNPENEYVVFFNYFKL